MVVFMPPPVEPGEAPININTKLINIEAELSLLKSMVLKPAVLVVTDWNQEARSLSGTVNPAMLILYSAMK